MSDRMLPEGQRAKAKGQRAKGKGQRPKGKGQRAKGKGQRAKSGLCPHVLCPLDFVLCPCKGVADRQRVKTERSTRDGSESKKGRSGRPIEGSDRGRLDPDRGGLYTGRTESPGRGGSRIGFPRLLNRSGNEHASASGDGEAFDCPSRPPRPCRSGCRATEPGQAVVDSPVCHPHLFLARAETAAAHRANALDARAAS